MNDIFHIVANVLCIMNRTAIISSLNLQDEAYWCFKNYMRQVETEFMEEGVLRKLGMYPSSGR